MSFFVFVRSSSRSHARGIVWTRRRTDGRKVNVPRRRVSHLSAIFPVSDFARVALLPSPPVRNFVPIARAVPARGVALMPPPLQQQPSVGTAAAQRRSAAFAALRLTSPARSRRESTRALAFPSTNSGRSLVRRRRQAAATRGAASPSQHSGRERTTNQARRRTPARTTKMAGERRCRGRRTT